MEGQLHGERYVPESLLEMAGLANIAETMIMHE
jgi:hypothetical protein